MQIPQLLRRQRSHENNQKHYVAGDGWTTWSRYIWKELKKNWSFGNWYHKGIQSKPFWCIQTCIYYLFIFLKILYNASNYLCVKSKYLLSHNVRLAIPYQLYSDIRNPEEPLWVLLY